MMPIVVVVSQGSVCDDGWNAGDTEVACRELGYSFNVGSYTHGFNASARTDPIHMDDVACDGNEDTLQNCTFIVSHNCGKHEDVGVWCTNQSTTTSTTTHRTLPEGVPTIRLVGKQEISFDDWGFDEPTFGEFGRLQVFVAGAWVRNLLF